MIKDKIWEVSKRNIGVGQMSIWRSSDLKGREIWENIAFPAQVVILVYFKKRSDTTVVGGMKEEKRYDWKSSDHILAI